MAEQFYTILTNEGKAKIANCNALGTKVNFTKFKVGDGAGAYYNPTEDMTELKNIVYEGNIGSISIDSDNPNWIILEFIIPGNVGGFTIREAGIYDDSGALLAIGKYPETYKPVLQDGSLKDLSIKMIIEVSNTASVTLKIDPTVVLATQKDIEKVKKYVDIQDAKNLSAAKAYADTKAEFKKGSGVFAANTNTCVVEDTFITEDTLVTIIPATQDHGIWSGRSESGKIIINSDITETVDIAFDWAANKGGRTDAS